MFSPELVDERILNQLRGQINRKKWATTYLLTGKEPERKKALAIAFAKALNCENKGDRSCDCSTCTRIEAGTYPDVKWYGIDEETNSVKISEVRDFKNWLNLKSFEGKTKVFIFNGAERLTAEAQNALLKSLEEPPPGNVILLLVPNRKLLFDTIASRAVEIKVPSFRAETVLDILIRDGVPRQEAEFLARMSQGELARAKAAHEHQWFGEKNQWIDALAGEPQSLLERFHRADRGEARRVFDFLVEWLRDLVVFRAAQDEENLIHADRIELIKSISMKHDLESILELFDALNQIRKSIDDYANQKLALTAAEVLLTRFLKS